VGIAVLLVKKREGQPKPDCKKKNAWTFQHGFIFFEVVYSYLAIKWIANTDKLRALSETGLANFKPQEDRIIPKGAPQGRTCV
jgi:hypothetical protein